MRLALVLYSVQVLTRGAGERGYIALGMDSALVLTRGAWERGKPWACTLYWCSPGEPGNEASHELSLLTGAHQESLETRLAKSPYWCSSREPGNKASLYTPRDCTPYWCSTVEPGNKASLYTCSPGEPGMRLAQGL